VIAMPRNDQDGHHPHRLTISTVGGYAPAWLAWAFAGVSLVVAAVMCVALATWLWRKL
jgi:hypothetical protein